GAQRDEQEDRDRDAHDREKRAPLAAPRALQHEAEELHADTCCSSDPFSRCSTRVARSAACGSWVTITIVFLYSWLRRCSSVRISAPDFASRSPVGSSARSSVGSVTIARAIATRCSCPPESCRG